MRGVFARATRGALLAVAATAAVACGGGQPEPAAATAAPKEANTEVVVSAVGNDIPIPTEGELRGAEPRDPQEPIATPPADTTGTTAPTFDLPSLTGKGRGAVQSGKVTIVAFWATWCAPCERSFPKLQELYAKLAKRGVEIVAVSVDDDTSEIAAFAKSHGAVTFPVVWDKDKDLAAKYQVATMPSTFIVDKDGKISRSFGSYEDGQVDVIAAHVTTLLPPGK